MALIGTTIRADELPQDERGDFSAIPAGDYAVVIDAAEIKATKTGTGQYIKLKLKVTGPTNAGRVLFSNVNILNQSPEAERIGRQELRKIMEATGVLELSDSDQLIGGHMIVKVTVKTSEQYGAENEVKGYRSIGGAPSPMPSTTPPAQPSMFAAQPPAAAVQQQAPAAAPRAAAASTAGAPPWARKG